MCLVSATAVPIRREKDVSVRVGLVLGGGGVVGASWTVGALQALEDEFGFRADQATRVLGTSAGALVGTMGAAGISPAAMAEYATGTASRGAQGAAIFTHGGIDNRRQIPAGRLQHFLGPRP